MITITLPPSATVNDALRVEEWMESQCSYPFHVAVGDSLSVTANQKWILTGIYRAEIAKLLEV
jgi:hypothetical protein